MKKVKEAVSTVMNESAVLQRANIGTKYEIYTKKKAKKKPINTT